jgi:PAP2 superfamily protein
MALLPILLLSAALDATSGATAPTAPAAATIKTVDLQDVAPPEQPPEAGGRQADQSEAKKPPTPPHTGVHALLAGVVEDFKHLPTVSNLEVAAIGGAAALSVHPVDDEVNAKLRGHNDTATPIFAAGKFIGQTAVQVSAALGTYAYGRLREQPKAAHLGMDLLRAHVLDGVLTAGLKFATHRERPDGSNSQSFPSGHASVTFATATVIERHLGWKYSALGYAIASYVAASRLHDNRHYLSDVVFGAAVGTLSGMTVTQHGANSWTFTPAAVPGGVMLVAYKSSSGER